MFVAIFSRGLSVAIFVQCSHCQSKFETDASHAGKTTHCPSCRQPLTVPQIDSEKSSAAVQNSSATLLLEGFSGPIEQTRPTLRYRLSTVVVAAVMVLLPLVYLTLIGLVGYGVYYHAVHHTGTFEFEFSVPRRLLMMLAYSGPLCFGILLILFLLKPLFPRQAAETRTRSLNRDREPLLFAFIDRICQAVGAPLPTRIDLDCQLNASASYGRGFACLFGNHLVLTIGLPLVAGLNTRQFAGVLAHEFGHFAQGTGMRLTYLIRTISHWLLRVVYERDAVDDWLARSAESLDFHLAWVFYLAMMFVWISRQILWVLMMLGHLVGSYLLRQMEFDADRYETRLAGSQTFMQTTLGLQILGVATERVYVNLPQNLRERQLVDDLPTMIVSTAEQLPEAVQEAVLSSIEMTSTHWLDTHPADRDRIACAQQEKTEGVFREELPATILFNNFEAQAKATTWEFYRNQFGNDLERSQLVPISAIRAKQKFAQASQNSLDRFFQGNWLVTLPFALRYKHSQPAENAQETLDELKTVRQQMQNEMAAATPAFESLRRCQSQLAMAEKLRHCCRAGLEVEVDGLANHQSGDQEANKIEAAAQKEMVTAFRSLETYQDVATRRLGAALQLLHEPQVAKRIPNSNQAQRRCQELLSCYTALSGQMPILLQIMHLHGALGLLIERLPEEGDDSIFLAIQGITRQVDPAIRSLRNSWQRCPYPYQKSEEPQSLCNFLIPELPISDQASTIYNCCDQAVSGSFPLYLQLLGDLTRIAEAVENALGLPSLPETAPAENNVPSEAE